MSDSRTKNTTRNIVFGFIYRIINLILPFISRSIIIFYLGTNYLGIGSLFTSLLSFLSLAELGMNSAIVFAMYKPIAENDLKTIGKYLKYYRKMYRLIGLIILVVGVLLLPLLPYLTKSDTPADVNLYLLYSIYLLNSVISYFIAGYRQSLLTAYQRNDIIDKISTLVMIGVRIIEILVLLYTKNFYYFAFVQVVGTLTTNVFVSKITRKMYPQIVCDGELSDVQKKEITKKLSGLFGTKLNSIVVNQADTIVISTFLGLTVLGKYSNYFYIMNSVAGFIIMIFTSMTASIGNKIASDPIEDSYILFKKISFINTWIVGWCSICLLCLFQPFMMLWSDVSGQDISLPLYIAIFMSIYFYVYQVQRTLLAFKDAAGLWYEDRFRPYISMIINVVFNIILVIFFGLIGVIISTIIAFGISLPWCNYIVFKNLFKKSHLKNLLKIVLDFLVFSIVGIITFFMCDFFDYSLQWFVVRLLICIVLPNVLLVLFYHRTKEFIDLYTLVIQKINRIIKKNNIGHTT